MKTLLTFIILIKLLPYVFSDNHIDLSVIRLDSSVLAAINSPPGTVEVFEKETQFNLGLIGQVSVGKTTIINSMLGEYMGNTG